MQDAPNHLCLSTNFRNQGINAGLPLTHNVEHRWAIRWVEGVVDCTHRAILHWNALDTSNLSAQIPDVGILPRACPLPEHHQQASQLRTRQACTCGEDNLGDNSAGRQRAKSSNHVLRRNNGGHCFGVLGCNCTICQLLQLLHEDCRFGFYLPARPQFKQRRVRVNAERGCDGEHKFARRWQEHVLQGQQLRGLLRLGIHGRRRRRHPS
mmetsp:Transcript_124328/g.310845  ORF Transcript_124328/g.310845 Transcript_124328/m.310845 type:complete len:209 (-) Transcript_124328:1115-1741(-)